jgi:hypothetical protein
LLGQDGIDADLRQLSLEQLQAQGIHADPEKRELA